MKTWQTMLQNNIITLNKLQKYINFDTTALKEIIANFPMHINPYFKNLIPHPNDSI